MRLLLHGVLPAAVLYGGFLGARHLMATAPESARKPRPPTARPVEVVRVTPTRATPKLESMGLVGPAREVTIRSRVAGRVETIANLFELGGRFLEGEPLLQIEKADFDLAEAHAQAAVDLAATALARSKAQVLQAEAQLEQRRTSLAEAEANLLLEEGKQEIARREFEMLESSQKGANRDLALRAPQLAIARSAVTSSRAGVAAAEAGIAAAVAAVASAQANVEAAGVGLRGAELDLERTTVAVPFNAWVRATYVEVGSVISTQTNVADLVGADEYWVEVSLPVIDLQWLRLPPETGEGGARVVLRDESAWGPDGTRKGRLVRLLGDLERGGRLARLLVEVSDPLHLAVGADDRHPLLIGGYVAVEIDGRAVDGVFVLAREWLRHGDVVWVADADDKLRIRPAEVRWRGRSEVFLTGGLEPGDRVVITDLASPVEGMALRVMERGTESAER